MKIKSYSLNTAAREKLANWVCRYHKANGATNLTTRDLIQRAEHAAGACGADCVLCRPCVVSHTYAPQWALDKANDSADNNEGRGYVELSQFETYSGHTERVDFVESDFDVTEEDDGEPDDGDE